MAIFDAFTPDIPEPVKPKDFYAEQRRYYEGIIEEGDPFQQERQEDAVNRIFANAPVEPVTSNPATFIEQSNRRNAATQDQVANYLSESQRQEEQLRREARQQKAKFDTMRARDLNEYRNLLQEQRAAEAAQQSNFATGLLRSGIGLAATAIGGPAAGGISQKVVDKLLDQRQQRRPRISPGMMDEPLLDQGGLEGYGFGNEDGTGMTQSLGRGNDMDMSPLGIGEQYGDVNQGSGFEYQGGQPLFDFGSMNFPYGPGGGQDGSAPPASEGMDLPDIDEMLNNPAGI